MKGILIALGLMMILSVIVLAGCRGKRGNGHVTTEKRTVSRFSKLTVKGIFPVELTQDGGAAWVKVETDENLQPYIKVNNNGDELFITMDEDLKLHHSTKMKVYVNVNDLRELNFNSVGSLYSDGTLKLDSLEINSESVGKLQLALDAGFLRANLKSVGSTTLNGNVREARINNKSVGALKAFGLKAATLMIHNTSVGSAEVYADSAFYIRSSAIGTLHYKGPGEVKELNSEGIGKVEKVD